MGGYLPLAPGVSTVRCPIPQRTFKYVATVQSGRTRRANSLPSAQMQHGMLFDHLVGAGKKRRRHVEAERLRHDQVNDEVELGRLLDRKIGGLRPRKILSTKSPARR
jgi:hypothetical protein